MQLFTGFVYSFGKASTRAIAIGRIVRSAPLPPYKLIPCKPLLSNRTQSGMEMSQGFAGTKFGRESLFPILFWREEVRDHCRGGNTYHSPHVCQFHVAAYGIYLKGDWHGLKVRKGSTRKKGEFLRKCQKEQTSVRSVNLHFLFCFSAFSWGVGVTQETTSHQKNKNNQKHKTFNRPSPKAWVN